MAKKIKVNKQKTNNYVKSQNKANDMNYITSKEIQINSKYNFIHFKFESFKTKTFTNFVRKDEREKYINKFFNELPMITQELRQDKHFHSIDEKNENAFKTIKDIIKNEFEKLNIEDMEMFQIPFNQGMRMICMKIGNEYYPLFLDVYHLIFPDIKYNQKDFMKNNICLFKR